MSQEFGEKSGAYESYLKSLNWLSQKYCENKRINRKYIYDIKELENLYTEVLEIQKTMTPIFFIQKVPPMMKLDFFQLI